MSYKFRFDKEVHDSYFFTTDYGVKYEVRFKEFFYLFDKESEYTHYTYEFSIILLHDPTEKSAPTDTKIAITISAIFDDFFERQTETVAIYICDSSDGRQMARHRKFSTWFGSFGNDKYLKIDFLLDEETVPVSLVLQHINPYKDQIIREFEMITGGYGQIEK
jgi:Family of unknown function (DUF6169)